MYGYVPAVREGGENCPEHGRETGKGLSATAPKRATQGRC